MYENPERSTDLQKRAEVTLSESGRALSRRAVEEGSVLLKNNGVLPLKENAKIVDESELKDDVVNIGSKVKVYDETFDEEIEYIMVGSNEVNAAMNMITDRSPVGSALMGAKAGDKVSYTAPCGEVHMKILEVSRAKKN